MLSQNKVVQSLWIGQRLGVMQRLSIESFLRQGHQFHLYVYNDVQNVPPGVTLCDAEEIISSVLYNPNRFSAGVEAFADFFRYKLMLERGGWWTDTDVICLRPLYFSNDTVISSEATRDGVVHPNIGNLKFPVGSPALAWMWQVCQSRVLVNIGWAEAGPALMKAAVRKFNLEPYVQPPQVFCPLPWWDASRLQASNYELPLSADTHAVHLWGHRWGLQKMDPNLFPLRSPWAELRNMVEANVAPDLSDVTAVIKTFLRDNSLIQCVKTLKRVYPSLNVIVADDGYCSREKGVLLKGLGVDEYLELPWNRGLAAGRNALIERVRTPYILLCDDDFSFTPDCHVERLRALMPICDIAGGLVFNLQNWRDCARGRGWDVTGGALVQQEGLWYVDGQRTPLQQFHGVAYESADFVLNFFVAKTEIMKKVIWDEDLYFSCEHLDFALRAKQAGVVSVRSTDAFVYHKEMKDSGDYEFLRSDAQKYHRIFREKWGFDYPQLLSGTLPTIDLPEPPKLSTEPRPKAKTTNKNVSVMTVRTIQGKTIEINVSDYNPALYQTIEGT